jgi:hypothetical protein
METAFKIRVNKKAVFKMETQNESKPGLPGTCNPKAIYCGSTGLSQQAAAMF